jgi:hypothetical protein
MEMKYNAMQGNERHGMIRRAKAIHGMAWKGNTWKMACHGMA